MYQTNRFLGLDFGSKRIGIALSDYRLVVASPLTVLLRRSINKDIQAIINLIKEHNIIAIVIGLPLNLIGDEGPAAIAAKKFVCDIETAYKITTYFWDERCSTAAVERSLIAADISRKRRSEIIDKIAAAYILQSFLDNRNIKKDFLPSIES